MKKHHNHFRVFSLLLALCCIFGILGGAASASAATVAEATIDMTKTGSLTLYKYDFTNAAKDGVWSEDSFVSTGVYEKYVNDTLGSAIRQGDTDKTSNLGNGETSNGYAIKGVEFSYLKVADIVTYSEYPDGTTASGTTMVLYGFNKTEAADLLSAIGLANGAGRYTAADNNATGLDATNNWYYTSDTINAAMKSALAANSSTVKNALEAYMANQGGSKMPLTDADGRTSVSGLQLGLYLLVETKVPEMVTSTTNPFFISLPMTTVSGDANSASPEGGHFWNYDVTVYPKNETGIPSLEKTVREAQADTGDNTGSNLITDGYSHIATGSAGDTMEFQIISTLPTITSDATKLSVYNFYDVMEKGLSYNKDSVKVEIYEDAACTKLVKTWAIGDKKFDVTFTDATDAADNTMTIDFNAAGLAEVNGSTANANGALHKGYSNYTVRVTYTAVINSNDRVVFGDEDNENKVVLTWKRSSSSYYDTLIDDSHVYTYGLNLQKLFSDKAPSEAGSLYDHVKFVVQNQTDGYFIVAELNEAEGVYYVTGHTTKEEEATIFTPKTWIDDAGVAQYGRIVIWGLEDDQYIITETETANGYTLLRDNIDVVISTAESTVCDIYEEDTLGAIQNDPRYAFAGKLDATDAKEANVPQKQLEHKILTASATVNGDAVKMLSDVNTSDVSSANAAVQFSVTNTHGFDIPATGDVSAILMGLFGVAISGMAIFFLFFLLLPKRKEEKEER